MALFRLFSPKSSPSPEPVYSELGELLWRLMDEKEGEWQVRDALRHRYDGCYHPRTGTLIDVANAPNSLNVRMGPEGSSYVHHLLTPDDKVRLNARVRSMVEDKLKFDTEDQLRWALDKLNPSPFDADCRTLARAVLRGDKSAARPLVDKAMECLMENPQ